MVTVVIIINFLIALLCLYVAWQVLKLRRTLARVADTLVAFERSTHNTLHRAPEAIAKGQLGVYQLRQQYRQLEVQLRQVQNVLMLLQMGQTAWRGRSMTRSFRSRSRSF